MAEAGAAPRTAAATDTAPRPDVTDLRLELLGGLRLSRDGAPLTGLAYAKGRALLAYLALTGRPHTREALGSKVARSIGSESVRKHLEKLFAKHGPPKFIRADNGREFIGEELQLWLKGQGVAPVFIEKASPTQNCYIERVRPPDFRSIACGSLSPSERTSVSF